jgi:hypothetical protein
VGTIEPEPDWDRIRAIGDEMQDLINRGAWNKAHYVRLLDDISDASNGFGEVIEMVLNHNPGPFDDNDELVELEDFDEESNLKTSTVSPQLGLFDVAESSVIDKTVTAGRAGRSRP